MSGLEQWWETLTLFNRGFFIAASFFSVFFIWQLAMAIFGLGGAEGDVDSHVDTGGHDTPGDSHETVAVFKFLSVRSVIAFFTLFTWAGALYLQQKLKPALAMTFSLLWGLAAMLIVSGLFYMMRRLTHSGNMRMDSCVGTIGTVYLDIPANGEGEVRVLLSGVITLLKARSRDGLALKSGMSVRIVNLIGGNVLEVESVS